MFSSQVAKVVRQKSLVEFIKWLTIFSIATNLLLLAAPLHMLQVYDRVLASRSIETLIYITLITVVAMAFYSLAEVVRGILAQRLSARFTIEFAEDLFREIVREGNPAKSSQLLRDLNQVQSYLSSRSAVALFDLPFAPFFLLLMFLLHITLGLLAVVGVALMVAVALLNKKITDKLTEASTAASSEAITFSVETLKRSDDIRAMGLLPSIMAVWGRKTSASLQTADKSQKYTSVFYGISKMIRQSLQVIVMAWGAYLVIGGDMSGGMIFASSMILSRALMPIEQLIGAWPMTYKAWMSYKKILEATDRTGKQTTSITLPEPKGFLTVENLVYSPNKNSKKPLLNRVSFQLEPGVVTALLGPSACGKSTLAKLLVGAITPDAGTVRLDDFELNQWPESQRGSSIGYVPQDIMLFSGTVAQNIARLDPNADDAQIVKAAQRAGVHELISKLPEGYSTLVGPSGLPLSGGQRQRIALARALYSSPLVLILDEPNAHLDTEGEDRLMNTILEARDDGVAVLIVSHRHEILKIVDQVLVLRDGDLAAAVNSIRTQTITSTASRPKIAANQSQVAGK